MKLNFRSLSGLLVLASVSAHAVDYTLTDLGAIPGGFDRDFASGLNASGDVTGYVSDSNTTSQAFRYESGVRTLVPTLGGVPAYGFAINDAGTVVGQSRTGVGFNSQAFRQLSGGAVESLGSLGGNFSEARAINGAGTIVGGAFDGSTTRAFVWTEGSGMVELGGFTASGSSIAYGINGAGRIAGSAATSGGDTHGFYYNGSSFVDVGTIASGTTSNARALNDSGVVVGYGGLTGGNTTYGAFMWTQGGGITELGSLFTYDTRAQAINSGGDIVGSSWIDSNGNSRAVLWKGGGAVANLNDLIDPSSGWLLTTATGINDAGQIVGVGRDAAGGTRAFLLNPVPEPASMVALGLGAAALLRRRRRN